MSFDMANRMQVVWNISTFQGGRDKQNHEGRGMASGFV